MREGIGKKDFGNPSAKQRMREGIGNPPEVSNMERQIDKRGVITHIEMIVSFAIFLVSVLFIFSFLNPIEQPDISSSLLRLIESGIEKDYSITILEIPVIIDNDVDLTPCFKVGSPFNSTIHDKMFVKNENYELVHFHAEPAGCSGPPPDEDPIGCIGITTKSSSQRVYYLYHTEHSSDAEIGSPAVSCSENQLDTSEYEYSIPRVKDIYLNSTGTNTLEQLKIDYENDYESLKEKFDFPEESDFSIIINKQDTNIVKLKLSREKPEKVVVKAKEVPIVIIEKTSSGDIEEITEIKRERIEELKQLRDEMKDDDTKQITTEQIEKIEQDQKRLKNLAREEKSKGIFSFLSK